VSRWKRRARNNKSFEVREALQARTGVCTDLSTGTAQQRATALVMECGDLLLEYLVTTATESLHRATRRERRRDERALSKALGDTERVERAWIILTRGLVDWTLAAASESDATGDVPIHEQAAALLAEHFPLNDEDEEYLRVAPLAEQLGFHSEELMLTSAAFDALLGDRAGRLALLADIEPHADTQLLRVAFEHGSQAYMELLAAGVIAAPRENSR
jgi:hypothetical protein